MKNICIIFLLSIIISVTVLGIFGGSSGAMETVSGAGENYLRIHIRADSNEEEAQAVKYAVRDEVVEYLTPLVAQYTTKTAAMSGVNANLRDIEKVAGQVLQNHGFHYGVTAEITVEQFPTRVYGEYILPAGEYSALILRLGRGQGDNWWCVVYPPLCFTGADGNIIYKSKIKEIINRFYS